MNQGHDVVEFIHGHAIKPADHPLEYQFHGLPFERDVGGAARLFSGASDVRTANSLVS
jgi:hypothetical protein